ncbi:hypothetical protein Dimus_038860 [Dionaea muscipula]
MYSKTQLSSVASEKKNESACCYLACYYFHHYHLKKTFFCHENLLISHQLHLTHPLQNHNHQSRADRIAFHLPFARPPSLTYNL